MPVSQEVTNCAIQDVTCRETPTAARQCFCQLRNADGTPTRELPINGTTCTDIDECANSNGMCEHNCQNTRGSYQCTCNQGFTLHSNKKDCKGIPIIKKSKFIFSLFSLNF